MALAPLAQTLLITAGRVHVDVSEAVTVPTTPAPAPTLAALTLAASTVVENSAANVVVGGVLGRTIGSTLSLVDSAGGRFALSGSNLVTAATATDYEAAASHSITLRETLAGATGSPRDTVLTVTVVNQFERPNLAALAFSSTSFVIGTASSGSITGATAGSTIAASGLPSGLTVNGAARTWAWSGSGSAATSVVALTETLADSANSPRASTVNVTISATPSGTATAPQLTPSVPAGTNPMSWDAAYADMIADSDIVTCRWRSPDGSGAWTVEDDHLFTSDDFLDSMDGALSFPWPKFDAATFAAGATVEVQEGVKRGSDPVVWSASLIDTMQNAVDIVSLRSDFINFGYGAAAVSLASPVPVPAGAKVLVVAEVIFNGANTMAFTFRNADTNAVVVFTPFGNDTDRGVSTARTLYAFWADTAGLTNLQCTLTPSGSTVPAIVHFLQVKNALAGGPAAFAFLKQMGAGGATSDVDLGLALAANGRLAVAVFNYDQTALDFTGAAKLVDVGAGQGFRSAVAVQNAAGDVLVSDAPAYGILDVISTKWNPA